jgi:hypothetical protein
MNAKTHEPKAPAVGEGATYHLWSDAHAYTVERVSASGKTAWIRRDKATLLNGANSGEPDALKFSPGGFAGHTSGTQRWAYEPDPEGKLMKVTRRVLKSGKVIWKQAGWRTSSPGGTVSFGHRSEHYDHNF